MNENKKYPSYSVLMSVYAKDNAQWLQFSIDSMLRQTVPPSEFVIVTDGPVTDELQNIIDQNCEQNEGLFKIVKLSENRGLGEALKAGIPECSCEWIARMDADDYSVPQRCEIQLEAAKKHNADIVGSDCCEFIGNCTIATKVFPQNHSELVKFSKRRTPFCHPSVIMKKNAVLDSGNYQSAYLHEDFDLFIRLFKQGYRGFTVKEPLVFVRVNEDFYARRGGVTYMKALLNFNVKQYKSGWMSAKDFILRSGANIVSCLLPNKMRDFMYRRLLRK